MLASPWASNVVAGLTVIRKRLSRSESNGDFYELTERQREVYLPILDGSRSNQWLQESECLP